MRVVSWNVNGIRAGVRHGFVNFVDRSGADIVGVQEVRARPEDIPPAARRPPGWHTAFTVAERLGYSGVGLSVGERISGPHARPGGVGRGGRSGHRALSSWRRRRGALDLPPVSDPVLLREPS